jgi:hypothetical protein
MKLVLRENMSRGGTLAEQLAWLEGLGSTASSYIVHVHVADSNRLQLRKGHLDFYLALPRSMRLATTAI